MKSNRRVQKLLILPAFVTVTYIKILFWRLQHKYQKTLLNREIVKLTLYKTILLTKNLTATYLF